MFRQSAAGDGMKRMFMPWRLGGSTPLAPGERSETLRLLRMWWSTRDGSYLRLLDLDTVCFKWNHKFDLDNGVLGAFMPTSPRTIYLMPDPAAGKPVPQGEYAYGWILSLMEESIPHELTHMFQFRTAKVPYLLHAAGLRYLPWSIEPDAVRTQDAAKEFYSGVRREIDKNMAGLRRELVFAAVDEMEKLLDHDEKDGGEQ